MKVRIRTHALPLERPISVVVCPCGKENAVYPGDTPRDGHGRRWVLTGKRWTCPNCKPRATA